MYSLDKVFADFEKRNIRCFSTGFSSEYVNKSIRFFQYEEFIDFLEISCVKHIFVMSIYGDEEDYFISEDIIDKIISAYNKQLLSVVENEIDEYNSKHR